MQPWTEQPVAQLEAFKRAETRHREQNATDDISFSFYILWLYLFCYDYYEIMFNDDGN